MTQHCHLYHRVSLAYDAPEPAVLERLRRAAAERGFTVEAEHVDRQERPSEDRPAFDALVLALERSPAGLLALGLDRLFPTRVPAALRQLDAWLRGGVRLITLEPAIDTAEPASWAQVMAILGDLPRRQRSEATAAGHALRARAGLVLRNVWNDPEIRRRYRAGESQRVMARALGVCQSSLCRHLRDLRVEGYLGERDEAARVAAQLENPPDRGGRPPTKKPPSEPAEASS